MLDTGLSVLQQELDTMRRWTEMEMAPESPETAKSLGDIVPDELFDAVDDALSIFADARNSYAEARELTVPALTLYFSKATFDDKASMDEER